MVVRKLYWSCQKEKTKYGYKRPGLEKTYPEMCPLFDKYIYSNQEINKGFQEQNLVDFIEWQQKVYRLVIASKSMR